MDTKYKYVYCSAFTNSLTTYYEQIKTDQKFIDVKYCVSLANKTECRCHANKIVDITLHRNENQLNLSKNQRYLQESENGYESDTDANTILYWPYLFSCSIWTR
jgi:hypothetical protein